MREIFANLGWLMVFNTNFNNISIIVLVSFIVYSEYKILSQGSSDQTSFTVYMESLKKLLRLAHS